MHRIRGELVKILLLRMTAADVKDLRGGIWIFFFLLAIPIQS